MDSNPSKRDHSFESSLLAGILGPWGEGGDSQDATSGSSWHSRRCAPCHKSCGGSFCSLCFALLGTDRTSASPSSASRSTQHSGCPAALDEARAQLEKNEGEPRLSGMPSYLRTFLSWTVTAVLARGWLGNGCRSQRGQSDTALGCLTREGAVQAVCRDVLAGGDTWEQVGWVDVGRAGIEVRGSGENNQHNTGQWEFTALNQ